MKKKKTKSGGKSVFERIIEEAIVDCYNEYEQAVGWGCLFEEKINVSCECLVEKKKAILKTIEGDDHSNAIFGIIEFEKVKFRVPIEDISLENPKDMKYIEAYKYWGSTDEYVQEI